MKVTIENDQGEEIRATLPPAIWEGRKEITTGVQLTGLYYGPKSGRKIARYYSQWDNGHNVCVGDYFYEFLAHNSEDWILVCDKVEIDAPGVPVEDIA